MGKIMFESQQIWTRKIYNHDRPSVFVDTAAGFAATVKSLNVIFLHSA